MLECLCLITNQNNDKKVKSVYKKNNMYFNLTTIATGMASSSVLEYFGLEDIRKHIYLSVINSSTKGKILEDFGVKLKLSNPGSGICFSVPLSSSTKYVLDKLNINSKEDVMNKKDKSTDNYHLIITVVSEGFAEQVMNTAKKAGAGGGTLIRGRSLHEEDAKKQFLGFSIEPEKDVILIVAKEEMKTDIMKNITDEVGLKTKGSGIVFSLPISDVVGLYEQTKEE